MATQAFQALLQTCKHVVVLTGRYTPVPLMTYLYLDISLCAALTIEDTTDSMHDVQALVSRRSQVFPLFVGVEACGGRGMPQIWVGTCTRLWRLELHREPYLAPVGCQIYCNIVAAVMSLIDYLAATPGAFVRDPSLVWEFYNYRREV